MADATDNKTQTRPTRILFVVGRLDPTAPCRAVVGLARRLDANGHQVELACSHGSPDKVFPGGEQDAGEGVPVHVSRALKTNIGARLNLAGLVRRVKKIDPDIIHVHWSRLSSVAAGLVRRLRKPYVLSVGDFLDPGESISLSRRFIRKVIVASDAVRVDLVNRIGISRDLIQVVPDGVAMGDYAFDKEILAADRVPVVGTIGRFVESKGQEYLIRAAHLLATRGRYAQFVIAGEGPDRKRLQNLVEQLDLVGRVTFARAPVDQVDVLKAIDIFVTPSPKEALGLPTIEAMAAGIPVIATSAGGIFSLIENGKTGMLVPKRAPDAIATEIERLIDQPGTARQLAEAGRAHVAENFNIDSVADRMAAVYDEVLGDMAPPSAAAGS
jgi:glycosyltransferase involved in cell wall biosynthesis